MLDVQVVRDDPRRCDNVRVSLLSFAMHWGILIAPIAYPAYVLMAAVFSVCGVPRGEITECALKQADRQRFANLVRAARWLPAVAPEPPDGSSGHPGEIMRER
ncbi:hypothetical protein [Pseudonocardia alaniniphila]|uniref:Uncharacterized protein n=1 Tax=Pseudonocardia alaniniphila TaxID=75291 RepID=A0ABS9T9G2_9PSEU|nr:hypothetical protein [Pseudonocardia alaniniphila]MCH6165179.1 hypothetical protein [Pseudonocardia alaniniphila]